MDTDTWLAQYKDKVNGLKQAAADLQRDLAASTATVSSADESVTVTIGPNGSLRDVVFSQRAAEHSPAALAALLMKTVARGQRAVAEQVAAAFAPAVGEGTSAMALLTSFAPPADAGTEPGEELPPNKYDELAAGVPDAPPPPVPPPSPPVVPQPVRVAARPRRATDGNDDGDYDGRPW